MARLAWRGTKTMRWKGFELPCAAELDPVTDANAGNGQLCGIRPTPPQEMRKKRRLWRVSRALHHTIGIGFVERAVGRLVRRYGDANTDFLELGCGPMTLRRRLPRGCAYNGIDLAFSEFQLHRVLAKDPSVNIAIASATNLPLPDDSLSMIASVEVLYCIPPIDRAFEEMRRTLRPGGTMICSVANAHYHKYAVLGPHGQCVNRWTFQGFIDHAARHGFALREAQKIGYWLPITRPKMLRDIWLPIRPRDEYHTSNFIYAFELQK